MATPRDVAARKITAFYSRYFPEKVNQVGALLDRYPGREEDVIRTFRMKYGNWDWDYVPPEHPPSRGLQYVTDPAPPFAAHAPHDTSYHNPPSHPSAASQPAGAPARDHNVNITLTVQGANAHHATPATMVSTYPTDLSPLRAPLPPPQQTHPSLMPSARDPGALPPGPSYQPPPQHFAPRYPGAPVPAPLPVGAHPSAAHIDIVSRSEIEEAFATLEAKLTEAQKQDAQVIERKLDELLASVHKELPAPAAPVSAPPPVNVELQLQQIMQRIDNIAKDAPPPATTPVYSALPPPPPPSHPATAAPSPATDFIELLKQETMKKAKENDTLAKNAEQLQQMLQEQQEAHARDLRTLQQRLGDVETQRQQSAVDDQRLLLSRVHDALNQTVQSQQRTEDLHRSLLAQQSRVPSKPQSLVAPAYTAYPQQPWMPVPSAQPLALQGHAPPAAPAGVPQAGSDVKALRDELEELRKRDDLSRKLIHEKQILLDTMFALSHQQHVAVSPPRGMPQGQPHGQYPQVGGPTVSPGGQVHHHHYPSAGYPQHDATAAAPMQTPFS